MPTHEDYHITLVPKTTNITGSFNGPHLEIVHAVRKRDHKARVVVDGLVTENDINTVVEIPEIVLGCRQLAAVILWVIPE